MKAITKTLISDFYTEVDTEHIFVNYKPDFNGTVSSHVFAKISLLFYLFYSVAADKTLHADSGHLQQIVKSREIFLKTFLRMLV